MNGTIGRRNSMGTFLLGMLLLIFGVLLLISRAGVIDLNFTRIVAFMVVAVGAYEAIRSFASPHQRRLFWGSVLFLSGLLALLVSYDYIPASWDQIWPTVLLIPGLAFLMLYFANLKDFSLLVIAALFVILGWAGLMAGQGDFGLGQNIMETLRFVVPAAVVLAGVYVIWKNFFRTRA